MPETAQICHHKELVELLDLVQFAADERFGYYTDAPWLPLVQIILLAASASPQQVAVPVPWS